MKVYFGIEGNGSGFFLFNFEYFEKYLTGKTIKKSSSRRRMSSSFKYREEFHFTFNIDAISMAFSQFPIL